MSDTAAIKTDLEGETPPGRKGGEYCPELALITGALDPAWQSLVPEHPTYGRWHGVWRLQEEWSSQTHYWIWSAHLAGRGCQGGQPAQA